MIGYTWMTALALVAGLVVHALKAVAAHRGRVTLRSYWRLGWQDCTVGVICAVVMWVSIPEFAQLFPSLGVAPQPTIMSSFFIGYVGDSLADLLGTRVKRLT